MAQVEVSRAIVFTQPRYARCFFEALVTGNLDLGRPDTIEIIFGPRIINGRQRAARGTFKTSVITRGTDITINAFYRHSRIRQYLKDGRALMSCPPRHPGRGEPGCPAMLPAADLLSIPQEAWTEQRPGPQRSSGH